MNSITPIDLKAKLESGEISKTQILDVRRPGERREVHIEGSRFLPIDSVNIDDVVRLTRGSRTYLLCRSGARSERVQEKLAREGVIDPIVIDGGILAWENAGLPVVLGDSAMSLERQVRVAAGLLVVAGTGLGVTVNPSWHFLSGIVGAGLVVAGLTNTCALGTAISKLPWNRSRSDYGTA
jgi:rhodanese-related sulfurtransferase